jgi:hypothetical protein
VEHLDLVHGFFKENVRLWRFGGDVHSRSRVMREGTECKNGEQRQNGNLCRPHL